MDDDAISQSGFIYFIETEPNTIKVGWTGSWPGLRLRRLQTFYAQRLEFHGWIRASHRRSERVLHRILENRIRGEFFHYCPVLAKLTECFSSALDVSEPGHETYHRDLRWFIQHWIEELKHACWANETDYWDDPLVKLLEDHCYLSERFRD